MDRLENFMNYLTDMDWGWWPVLSLRPSKNKDIDNLVLFKLTLLFGTLCGLIIWLVNIWITKVVTWSVSAIIFLIGWSLFFLLFKFTFAYFWNRRANRLRKNNK
jgi:hypothetical protein